MNAAITGPSGIAPVDEDLAEQARPGHGIPSQAPNLAAQILQELQDGQREVESVLIGGGMVAGAAVKPGGICRRRCNATSNRLLTSAFH